MADNETKEVDVHATTHAQSAQAAGANLPDVIDKELQKQVEMKEDVKRSPLTIRFMLEDAGVDFSIFPVIDSTTGNNPHKFKDYNDKNKEVEGDWYREYAKGTHWGKELFARQHDLKLVAKAETQGQSVMYADHKNNELFIKDETQMIKARITSLVNMLTDAVGIYQKEAEFLAKAGADKIKGTETPKVELKFNQYMDSNGDVHLKRSNTPFVLHDNIMKGNLQRWNVNQFLKVDVDQAIRNGGTLACYVATLKTDTRPGGVKTIKIEKIQDAFAMLAELNYYFNPLTKEGQTHLEVAKKYMKTETGEEGLLALGGTAEAIDAAFTEELRTMYSRANAKVKKQAA